MDGCRGMATRMESAESAFLDTLMAFGGIDRAEARRVLSVYRRLRVVRMDAVGGTMSVTHGAFLDRESIRAALEGDGHGAIDGS